MTFVGINVMAPKWWNQLLLAGFNMHLNDKQKKKEIKIHPRALACILQPWPWRLQSISLSRSAKFYKYKSKCTHLQISASPQYASCPCQCVRSLKSLGDADLASNESTQKDNAQIESGQIIITRFFSQCSVVVYERKIFLTFNLPVSKRSQKQTEQFCSTYYT